MNVLVLHGPTVSFRQDLAEVDRRLAERARALGHVLRTVQTHHEGTLVDALWEQRAWAQGVLLNPGPLALGSHVLREAVAAGEVPVVEVLTVPAKDRSGLVRRSILREVCVARVSGMGPEAYLAGLERLAKVAAGRKSLGRGATASAGARSGVGEARPRAVEAPLRASPSTGLPVPASAPSSAPSPPSSKSAGHPARRDAEAAAPPKTLGRRGSATAATTGSDASPAEKGQTLGRDRADAPAAEKGKTIGRERPGATGSGSSGGRLTRAEVRARIADRLGGKVTPGALATWARGQWVALQQGAPVEAGQRELLDEALQALFLAVQPRNALGEEQLVEWMTALE